MNVKKVRDNEIRRLAERGDGDVKKARHLYNRCIRFALRYGRWSEAGANGGYGNTRFTRREIEQHNHEYDLLVKLIDNIEKELRPYGLRFEFPGLYPILTDYNGNHGPWLYWY